MSKTLISILLIVGMLLPGIVIAQQTSTVTMQFNSTPLNLVLDTLKRSDPSMQFTMASGLGDIKITASLVDVTVDSALQIILSQAGLTSVKDNGVYQIREKASVNGRGPTPTPRLSAPVFVNRPMVPGESTAIQTPGALAVTAEQKKYLPIRVITIKFADPALFAILFGGGVIYGDEGSSMGSNSGGNSSNSGGSSRGSSSRGSSSSSSSSSRR